MAVWTKLQAKDQVLKWQSVGNVVVFTNGCFDVLHRGHIDYLTEAKALGNKLIIGLNSDASVLLLKGEGRPVQPEKDRAVIIDALHVVDGVTIFLKKLLLNLSRN